MINNKKIQSVFFGTSEFSVFVLEELEKRGLSPDLIITSPDKPKGRKLVLTPPPVKIWAEEKGVQFLQPELLDENFVKRLKEKSWDVFLIASYGKIVPQAILDIPKHQTLNVHPSLLPKYRGASPIQSQILNDEQEIGVTIMLVDEKVDHGPILDQELVSMDKWPIKRSVLEKVLGEVGGSLLSNVILEWVDGNIDPQEQDHEKATFCTKIKKEDALIDLNADPYENLLKIYAFEGWPRAYYIDQNNKRVVIIDATIDKDGKLRLLRIIPEGKKEIGV